jgi:hypothetical protein
MKTLDFFKQCLWQQFGASIDMLKNAIEMWPEEKWESHDKAFYMAHHTLFFLDFYLTNPPENFKPRFSKVIDDVPDKVYSKKEILDYLDACRKKCRQVIESINENNLEQRWIEERWNRNFAMVELLMYNMRHVQHHAAQLNMMLRGEIDNAPKWVRQAID